MSITLKKESAQVPWNHLRRPAQAELCPDSPDCIRGKNSQEELLFNYV
jgi:hypothetical protein